MALTVEHNSVTGVLFTNWLTGFDTYWETVQNLTGEFAGIKRIKGEGQ